MAVDFNAFDPVGPVGPLQPPPQQQAAGGPIRQAISSVASSQGFQDLNNRWQGFISDPGNRSALLQTGLAMMQPSAPGQTFAGHVSGAVGQGIEARDRNVALREDRARGLREEERLSRALSVDERNALSNELNVQTALANSGGSYEKFRQTLVAGMFEDFGVNTFGEPLSEEQTDQQLSNILTTIPILDDIFRQLFEGEGGGAAQSPAIGAGVDPAILQRINAGYEQQGLTVGPNDEATVDGIAYIFTNGQWVPK